jgi:hypothetical protein
MFHKVTIALMLQVCLVVAVMLICTNGSPIMVYSGTRMLPITPPTPAPRLPSPFPPIPPAPVYEDPEPENSVYAFPFKFGYRLKPLSKHYVSTRKVHFVWVPRRGTRQQNSCGRCAEGKRPLRPHAALTLLKPSGNFTYGQV